MVSHELTTTVGSLLIAINGKCIFWKPAWDKCCEKSTYVYIILPTATKKNHAICNSLELETFEKLANKSWGTLYSIFDLLAIITGLT